MGRLRRVVARDALLATMLAAALLAGCDSGPAETANPRAAKWIAQLRAGDVQQRQQAIAELGRIDDPCVVGPLLETARTDNQWNLRVEAIRALGREGLLSDRGPLIALLADPKQEIRQTACEALGALKAREGEDALVQRLRDSDAGVRLAAIGALGRLGEGGLARLGKLLEGGSVDERLAIIGVLGADQAGRWTDTLIAMLKDGRSDIRRAAADALGRLGEAKAAGPLAELVREPLVQTQQHARAIIQRHVDRAGNAGLKAALAEAIAAEFPLPVLRDRLAREWWEGMVNPLRALIAEIEPEPRLTRQVALAALCRIQDPAVRARLIDLLGEGDPDVVALAAEVLAERSPQVLAEVAVDAKRPPAVREQAIRALVGRHVASQTKSDSQKLSEALGAAAAEDSAPDPNTPTPLSPELSKLLEAGLRDPSESVRAYCAAELAARKIDAALPPLLALLSSADLRVKIASVRALAHYADARAVDELAAILRQTKATAGEPPTRELRRAVLATLAATGDRRAAPDVLAIATDLGDPLVREAIDAVGALGDPGAGEALLALREKVAGEQSAPAPPGDKDRPRFLTDVHRRIVLALGRAKARQAVPTLIAIMQGDSRRGPVHEAMEALGDIGDQAAVEPIMQRLRKGPHQKKLDKHANYTTQAGIAALVKLGDPRAVELLKEYIASPPDDPTYNYAFNALGELKAPACADLLAAFLLSQDMDIAVKSAKVGPALAALGDVARPALLRLLAEAPKKSETSTYDAGVFAAQLLAMLDEQALGDLHALAGSSKVQHVLARLVVAAGNMRSPKAVDLLKVLASNGDGQVRLWAVGALGRLPAGKQAAARPILQAAASDADPKVARWAAEALGRWDEAAASQPASRPNAVAAQGAPERRDE